MPMIVQCVEDVLLYDNYFLKLGTILCNSTQFLISISPNLLQYNEKEWNYAALVCIV